MSTSNIAIFASGSGSNAENIIQYLSPLTALNVACVVSNKKNAGVLERAHQHSIPAKVMTNESFLPPAKEILRLLQDYAIDFIVLAGFLRKIPAELIQEYPERIINIHPSLLPDYGGDGMYGNNVHQAVYQNGEKKSGITIHTIGEEYDRGAIIAQFSTDIADCKSPEEIEQRVRKLEMKHFPETIQSYIIN